MMRELVDHGEGGYHATVAQSLEEAAEILAGLHPPFSIVELGNVIFNCCSAKHSEFGRFQDGARVITVEGARQYIFSTLEEISALGIACGQ